MTTDTIELTPPERSFGQRMLDGIKRVGNRIPHPAMLFVYLIIGVIVLSQILTAVIDLILTGAVGQWAIFAPIFIPLFLRLNISPATVLAAYRLGDSPLNVITPAMAYFPLIVIFAQRYRKSAGIGTVIAMMIPYAVILLVVWGVFFIIWYLLGIPLGPGAPNHL